MTFQGSHRRPGAHKERNKGGGGGGGGGGEGGVAAAPNKGKKLTGGKKARCYNCGDFGDHLVR